MRLFPDGTPLFTKSIVGLLAPSTSFFISFLAELEPILRVISLFVGISVGLVSIWSIWRHRNDGK